MPNGTIVDYLKRNPNAHRRKFVSVTTFVGIWLASALPRSCQVRDIAKGLIYVHSIGLVHGDLKAVGLLRSSHSQAGLLTFLNVGQRSRRSNPHGSLDGFRPG